LLLIVPAPAAPAEDQAASNELVTISTNSPVADPSAPTTRLALQPVGIVKEVEKLANAGTDPDVIKAFIQSWASPYSISVADILHLKQIGLPSDLLTALIQHGAELAAQEPAGNAGQPGVSLSASAPYIGSPAEGAQFANQSPPLPDQFTPQPVYPAEPEVQPYSDEPVPDGGYYSYPGPYVSSGIVIIGGGVGFHGRHATHPGDGGHEYAGGNVGHGSVNTGNGGRPGGHQGGSSGSAEHSGGNTGHGGSGSSGHGATAAGHSSGGHR
jgi:hypothetical protein